MFLHEATFCGGSNLRGLTLVSSIVKHFKALTPIVTFLHEATFCSGSNLRGLTSVSLIVKHLTGESSLIEPLEFLCFNRLYI